jgi:hypothetical protein
MRAAAELQPGGRRETPPVSGAGHKPHALTLISPPPITSPPLHQGPVTSTITHSPPQPQDAENPERTPRLCTSSFHDGEVSGAHMERHLLNNGHPAHIATLAAEGRRAVAVSFAPRAVWVDLSTHAFVSRRSRALEIRGHWKSEDTGNPRALEIRGHRANQDKENCRGWKVLQKLLECCLVQSLLRTFWPCQAFLPVSAPFAPLTSFCFSCLLFTSIPSLTRCLFSRSSTPSQSRSGLL